MSIISWNSLIPGTTYVIDNNPTPPAKSRGFCDIGFSKKIGTFVRLSRKNNIFFALFNNLQNAGATTQTYNVDCVIFSLPENENMLTGQGSMSVMNQPVPGTIGGKKRKTRNRRTKHRRIKKKGTKRRRRT